MLGVRVTGMAEVVVTLNGLDKQLVKDARKNLRTAAQPVARAVKSNIPREAPMTGMQHMGRTGWKLSGVKVNVKVNFSKKAERKGTSLVSIVVGGKGKLSSGSAAFQIADMAGRKARGKTASGRAMISKLNAQKKASRYVYPAAERELPYVRDQVVGTIRKLTKTYNDILKKG